MRRSNTLLAEFLAGISLFLFAFLPAQSQSVTLPAHFDSLVQQANERMYQDYSASIVLYEKAAALLKEHGADNHPLKQVNLLLWQAAAASYNFKISDTKKYIDQSLTFIAKAHSLNKNKADSLIIEARFIEALYFMDLGKADEALENLSLVENSLKKNPSSKKQCSRLFQVTQYQASIYQRKGEYESAVDQYIASIQYYDCYRDKSLYPNYVLTYRNIGKAYQLKGDMKKARNYFLRAKANLDSGRVKSSVEYLYKLQNHALILYNSMAEFYSLQRSLDSAKYFYSLALPLIKHNPSNSFIIYNGLGKIAQEEHDFVKALTLFRQAHEIVHKTSGDRNPEVANIYRSISQVHDQQGGLTTAMIFIQKALNNLQGPDESPLTSEFENPSLRSILSNKEMVAALNQKAKLLSKLYQQKKESTFLIKAHETNLLAIQILDSTRNDFTLEKDRVILGEEAIPVYETSLQLTYELYQQSKDPRYLDEFFLLMDKSKSAVLLDHMKLIRNFSGVPPAILERERQLKVELTIRENNLYKNESKDVSPKSREEIGDLKKQYAALHAEIKRNYPRYYALKIESRINTLSEIQKQVIEKDQALVEYFLGDTTLYMMCVTQTDARVSVVRADSLSNQIFRFRNLITDTKAHRRKDYSEVLTAESSALYNILVKPWKDRLDPSISSLIIVPQGMLNYLPFEVLSSETSDLLLSNFSVSYAASASMLFQQKLKESTGRYIAGFNADYSDHSALPPLPHSAAEVAAIVDIFGSGSETFTNATAEDFRREANQFRVLHFALHSYIDDERPLFSRLVFTSTSNDIQSSITANELYGMELNADLVVLSACETGIGQLHRGEGMMSLARAFMYSGVPSTVISLWKVPDNATSSLMTEFYKFLHEGQRKDEALANAKLAFVKNNPEMSTPFFWAGFVVNGKTEPVSISSAWTKWWIGAIVLIAGAAIWLMIKNRSKLITRG